MSTLSNKISNQPAALIALITIASAAAVTLAFQQHQKKTSTATNRKNKMPSSYVSKEAMIEAAGPPSLPDGYITDSFTNSRSQSIFTIHLPRANASVPPKAMFLLIHGAAEHCSRNGYIGLYESLSNAGVDVYSMDNHGQGRSDGEPRGYTETIDDYVSETVEYINLCKSNYDKDRCPPLVLMGHSLGGCIAVMTALKMGSGKSNMSLILSSPALGVDMNLELKVQKFFAPVIDFLCPKARIVDVVDPKEMSRNKDAVKAYIDDPFCPVGKMVARTAIATDMAFDYVKSRRGEIYCPTLMLHSPNDKCTSQKASEDFFANIGTDIKNKRYLKLNGMYHELLEEPETERIVNSIVTFAASGGQQFVEDEKYNGVVEFSF